MYLTVVPVVRLVLVLAVALGSAGADTYDCIYWRYFQQRGMHHVHYENLVIIDI